MSLRARSSGTASAADRRSTSGSRSSTASASGPDRRIEQHPHADVRRCVRASRSARASRRGRRRTFRAGCGRRSSPTARAAHAAPPRASRDSRGADVSSSGVPQVRIAPSSSAAGPRRRPARRRWPTASGMDRRDEHVVGRDIDQAPQQAALREVDHRRAQRSAGPVSSGPTSSSAAREIQTQCPSAIGMRGYAARRARGELGGEPLRVHVGRQRLAAVRRPTGARRCFRARWRSPPSCRIARPRPAARASPRTPPHGLRAGRVVVGPSSRAWFSCVDHAARDPSWSCS